MRRLGTLERIGQGRGLVGIEGEDIPPLGTSVVDETLAPIGTVVDVIGPVDAAWAVVDPATDVDLAVALGDRLYVREA